MENLATSDKADSASLMLAMYDNFGLALRSFPTHARTDSNGKKKAPCAFNSSLRILFTPAIHGPMPPGSLLSRIP